MEEKMKTDGLKKNLTFQFVYQIIVMVIPLIIAPYLTRTLGEKSIGIYTYTYSIAYYFVLFCMLGIVKHGQRVIAANRNNMVKLRKTFWSLMVVHVVVSIVGVVAYLIFVFWFCKEDLPIYYAQVLYVLSALFDTTWFYYGVEKIKPVVIRNALIKIVELVLIFLFVKNKDDLLLYTFIMSGLILICQMSLLPPIFKEIKPIKIDWDDIKVHSKPMIILSVSVFAVSLYTVFDKTLLGIMTTKESVAFYEYSNKIINIPKIFITVLGTVLFPRACNYVANQDMNGVKKYYNFSIMATYLIGFGSIFGLIGISDLFSILYYGKSFAICGGVIKMLSPIILFLGLGDIFRTLYLIPMHKDVEYTICIVINALINLVLSISLIPVLGIYGAVIGTLSAELFGVVYQGYLVRKYIDVKKTVLTAVPFIVAGLGMLGIIEIVKVVINNSIMHLILQMCLGALTYFLIVSGWFLIFSNEREMYKKVIKKIISKKVA